MNEYKEALVWLLGWNNSRDALQDCLWEGRGYAPATVADTIDALCKERWPTR